MLDGLVEMLGTFCQAIIDIVGVALNFIVSVLPSSPFRAIAIDAEVQSLIAKINFFIPVYEFLAIGQAWLIAIALFYLYSIFARWLKAIQ